RALGLVLAVLSFLSIDYFFQAPFDRFTVGNPLDWFVLVAFVLTAAVAANLLARAQAAAERARNRTEEVAHLSRLGAELLGAGTAENALSAIAVKVRETMNADTCAVFRTVVSENEPGVELVVLCGSGASVSPDQAAVATSRPQADAHSLIIPLRVHDRAVGVLGVRSSATLASDEASRRLFDALTYYAALAVERVTLVAQLEHAEALRESVRVREALLASVSHDLRTPLSTIKVLAQDLVSRQDLATATRNAAVIEEQADRLSGLVTNLLDLTRLRSSAFPVHPDINAAEDMIGAVARQVSGVLGDHPLERRIDRGGPVLLGRFDFVQSQRILVNLVENAVRYSSAGAPITLGVQREDGSLVFTVSNSGPGVAPTERERIFEPFYRSPAAAADVGGVGLGLYIGRALAEAQGGTLTLCRSSTDRTTFELRLPAVDAAQLDEAELLETVHDD
ncbi:MAG TPA: ATP-binding protein, partial [Gemmatimonadaceae bacterium]